MIFQKELISSLKGNGNEVAISSGDERVRYSGLLTNSDKITRFLLDNNTKKEAQVGVLSDDRIHMIISMIGIINAGCVFVPIDGELPEKRLRSMKEDLDLEYILTSKGVAMPEALSSVKGALVEDMMDGEDYTGSIEYPEFQPDDSLYIYFTSGSTGRPKGVIGKNCSLLQFLKWETTAFSVGPGNRFSQFISPYFDAFLRDIFVPLLKGGTICIPPKEEDFFTPEKLISWIDRDNVEFIHCVPSLFRVFNDPSLTPDHFKSLKYILLSGEKINPADLKNWFNVFGERIQLVNLYGLTETTMIRSFHLVCMSDVDLNRIPIGSPIDDTEFVISNKAMVPCKTLVPGDLYILSDFMSKGYLNRPELNKQKFLTINQGTPEEKIAFKTGDKARLMSDGRIELLGREDRQVKVRGIRIELDEIEHAISESEWVKNNVAIKYTEQNGDEALVSFVVSSGAKKNKELKEALEQYLKNNLPDYMIPNSLVEVDELPLLGNGKIDYLALNKLYTPKEIVGPVNEIESKVLEIWKEILGDKPLSTEDSFLESGGNSLSIMKLIGKIYKVYNVRISLDKLFHNLTIKKQADFISKSKKDTILTITQSVVKDEYNLSAAQERIYYNYELNRHSTAYNLPLAWQINEEFDKARAENALSVLTDRHESLRTSFKFYKDRYVQVVNDNVHIKIEEIVLDGSDIDLELHKFIKPFDLTNAPLIRCGVIKTTGNKIILVLDIHHIICDGASQMNLFGDFLKLYNGDRLSPLKIQYKDYAEWEHQIKTTDYYLTQRKFWLKSFEGDIPTLELPVGKENLLGVNNESGANQSFAIKKEAYEPIFHALKAEEITVFSGFCSIVVLFLSQLSGQEDIVLGINTSGRMQDELQPVIGMFAKTLPIRHKIDTGMPFKDYAKTIHQYLVEANSNQLYDMADIVKELNNGRSTPIGDLFKVMFVFQNFDDSVKSDSTSEFTYYEIARNTSKYPMTIYVYEERESMQFKIEYSLAYFTSSDTELLMSNFKSLLNLISENIDSKVIEYYSDNNAQLLRDEDAIDFNF
ncbi:MAG: amino acid adenylation domain-containing protein [Fulvivirga sp.]